MDGTIGVGSADGRGNSHPKWHLLSMWLVFVRNKVAMTKSLISDISMSSSLVDQAICNVGGVGKVLITKKEFCQMFFSLVLVGVHEIIWNGLKRVATGEKTSERAC